jgi:hypothetical protein
MTRSPTIITGGGIHPNDALCTHECRIILPDSKAKSIATAEPVSEHFIRLSERLNGKAP